MEPRLRCRVVVVTFALGLLLAIVFNDVRIRGRKLYRSLIIIPYALPGFMTALVWKGMFNETFGINKWLQCRHPVADERRRWRWSSLILVNLWLGYPYMFLVNTGALQSIPSELKEAALVDGANGWKAFRKITFPLLLGQREPAAGGQLRLQLQQLHVDLAAHQRQPTRHRRERRDDRHPADVGLPRRPRHRPASDRGSHPPSPC